VRNGEMKGTYGSWLSVGFDIHAGCWQCRKGKLADVLQKHYDISARFAGGSNAGRLDRIWLFSGAMRLTESCRAYACRKREEVCVPPSSMWPCISTYRQCVG